MNIVQEYEYEYGDKAKIWLRRNAECLRYSADRRNRITQLMNSKSGRIPPEKNIL